MRHFLLTRSAYRPWVPLERNRRRLALLQRVTAHALRLQDYRDLTWVVLVDHEDPLLDERLEVLSSAGLPLVTADAGKMVRDHRFDRPWADWSRPLEREGSTLTTRLDDDDAFAPWTLAHLREDAEQLEGTRGRALLIMALGWRLNGACADHRLDPTNQFISLWAPMGDPTTAMDMNHTNAARLARRIVNIETRPAWLWIRHEDARSRDSGATKVNIDAMAPISDDLRASFDIDWEWYEARYRLRSA